MDNIEKLCQKAPIEERRCGRWVAMALGCVLLFFTQATVSAKTLLEQYLNCDGFEEFVFYHEYAGKAHQFPNTYWCGAYQGDNFLLIRTSELLSTVPQILRKDPPEFVYSRFENEWQSFLTSPASYIRYVWKDKGIPQEFGNEIEASCTEEGIRVIRDYLLNFGLEHSNFEMTVDSGKYNGNGFAITYDVTRKNDKNLPEEIVAHLKKEDGSFPPITWRNVISYTNDVPQMITQYARGKSIGSENEDRLLSYIKIVKLIPAKGKLPREHFLRPGFENTNDFVNIPALTYYLQTNQLVRYDSKSNASPRLKIDDPKVYESRKPERMIAGYWIASALIASLMAILFVWRRKKK